MRATTLAALASLLLLTGCGWWDAIWGTHTGESVFDAQNGMGAASYVDRCTDLMRRAYPGTEITITAQHLGVTMSKAVVDVEGRRAVEPASAKTPRDFAAQCHFDHSVIVDFHWTVDPLL